MLSWYQGELLGPKTSIHCLRNQGAPVQLSDDGHDDDDDDNNHDDDNDHHHHRPTTPEGE